MMGREPKESTTRRGFISGERNEVKGETQRGKPGEDREKSDTDDKRRKDGEKTIECGWERRFQNEQKPAVCVDTCDCTAFPPTNTPSPTLVQSPSPSVCMHM